MLRFFSLTSFCYDFIHMHTFPHFFIPTSSVYLCGHFYGHYFLYLLMHSHHLLMRSMLTHSQSSLTHVQYAYSCTVTMLTHVQYAYSCTVVMLTHAYPLCTVYKDRVDTIVL